jgi:hypothetical protein
LTTRDSQLSTLATAETLISAMNVQPNVRNAHCIALPKYIALNPTFQRCIPWAIWSTPQSGRRPCPQRATPAVHGAPPRPPTARPPPPPRPRRPPAPMRHSRPRRSAASLRLTASIARRAGKSMSNGTSTHYDLGSVGQARAHEVRGAGAPGSVWPTGYVRRQCQELKPAAWDHADS